MSEPKVVDLRNARALRTQKDVLGVADTMAEHKYVNLIVPTLDVVQGGIVDSRIQSAICTAGFTSVGAGVLTARLSVLIPTGFTVRVHRIQAWGFDTAAATSWLVPAERVYTRGDLMRGGSSPPRFDELTLLPEGTNVTPVGVQTLNSPILAAPWSLLFDVLASGPGRITYEPAVAMLLERPTNVASIFDQQFGFSYAVTRTAAGAGEADTLAMHVYYSICGAGAVPKR